MILALNIGNSNITFGGYTPDGKLVFSSRLFADTALSSDELLYKIVNMLALYGAEPQQITAVIFSSVVPALTPRLREALRKMCECQIMEVGPGLKSGVRIRMDNPAQLGGELLCAIVGALQRCTPPCVVVNFDTATTLLAVDSTGALVGGSILPGPQCSLSALVRNTAQLPQVSAQRHCVRHGGHAGRHGRADPRSAGRPRRAGGRNRHAARQCAHGVCDGYCVPRDAGAGRAVLDLEEEYAEVTFWLRAIPVGGGVLDAPRRGQDPSLRCKPVTGGDVKLRAGHARPLRGGGWLAGAGREVRAAYRPLPAGRRIVLSVYRTNIILYPKRCCLRLFLFLWCRVIIYYV